MAPTRVPRLHQDDGSPDQSLRFPIDRKPEDTVIGAVPHHHSSFTFLYEAVFFAAVPLSGTKRYRIRLKLPQHTTPRCRVIRYDSLCGVEVAVGDEHGGRFICDHAVGLGYGGKVQ